MATPSNITLPEPLLPRPRVPAGTPRRPCGDDDEDGPETDDPAEGGAFDPDVEIHAAMLARERAGASLPDGDALEAMEEPLHRLTSAAVLFSDVTAENSPGPELRMRGLSFLAESISLDAFRLFRLHCPLRRASAEALLRRDVIRGSSP